MEKFELIKFKLNNEPFIAKKLDVNQNLYLIRQKLKNKLKSNYWFSFSDGTVIDKEDENNIKLDEIIDNTKEPLNAYIIFEEKKFNKNTTKNDEKPAQSCKSKEEEEEEEVEEVEEEEEEKEEENGDAENNGNSTEIPTSNDTGSYYSLSPKTKLNEKNSNNENKDFAAVPLPLSEETMEENNKQHKFNKKELSDKTKFEFLEKKGNLDIYLYKSRKFNEIEEINSLSLMVVGETGCGKTTLLNSFINNLLGVEFNDDFRFKIIYENTKRSQAYSQTDEVKYYNIKSLGNYPPIRIIDTPGYGDTRGIQRDKEITSQIKTLFKEKINTLNCICFVSKSSNNRLTLSQKYILSSILNLFGEDVKEIFVFMLTFGDGGKPNIIEPLLEKDCPFSKIISLYRDNSWYYKFNNSAIFESNRDDEFTKIFWKIGMKNFSLFKEKLKLLPKKSLALSRKVLEERISLEEKVDILTKKLRVGLNKIEEIKGIIKMICELKGDLKDLKNYTKIIKVPTVKKIDKDPNYYATTCIICSKTCHSTCRISDDANKKKCSAMNSKGFCMYCPKKCKWDQHKNRDYILEDVEEEKEITLEELKKRYYNNRDQLCVKRQLFNGAREELVKLNIDCLETQECITKSINLLHKIALNKTVFESAEEYIDLLIEIEKSENKPGWQKRIEGLNILKDEKKMLRELYQGTNAQMKQIREFVEKEINKYYEIGY